ncbi:hypothetical protein IB286_13480 [Spongiibacter sp. KMU-158]|uniref:Delta-aminolevulinic acid dehydratase n=1 Tax=Spongiibacter pelagi TaxID=2760804 RepID=A0A927GX04_9GAMM|nr:hypothetical protein [Spongiibacter pelagi]MBD2860015.1 hypothetical protein [Spongiibacter pelagi]
MRKRFSIPALLLLIFASGNTFACDCLWQGPFKSALEDADLVVRGTISQRRGNSTDLIIAQILKGKEYRQDIRLWGKYADECRPELSDFTPGTEWVLALNRIDNPPDTGFDPFRANISFGRQDDYSLSSCRVSWLPVNENRVSGNIVSAPRWQYLDIKKTPVIWSLFEGWFSGEISDDTLAEAARPQSEARQLLNNTRLFLWERDRESGDSD